MFSPPPLRILKVLHFQSPQQQKIKTVNINSMILKLRGNPWAASSATYNLLKIKSIVCKILNL